MNTSLESVLGKVADTVEFLEFEDIGINDHGVFDNTPLHVVISWRDDAAITTLIAGGADVNAAGESGFTPLHKAIMMKNVSAVEILLSHGADPTVKNDDGDDAVQLARKVGDVKIIEALQNGFKG
jgi:ankyrin repeat protein